jgi:hypothetical protein
LLIRFFKRLEGTGTLPEIWGKAKAGFLDQKFRTIKLGGRSRLLSGKYAPSKTWPPWRRRDNVHITFFAFKFLYFFFHFYRWEDYSVRSVSHTVVSMLPPLETTPLIDEAPPSPPNPASEDNPGINSDDQGQQPATGPSAALNSISRRLYVSHFLSTGNSRVFEFGSVLYLASIFPGTLLPLSVYAVARGLAAILLSPALGHYIDTADRLRVVRLSIGNKEHLRK